MKTPAPPELKRPRTEPSVQMVRSALGSEDRWPLAKEDRRDGGSDLLQGMDRLRDTVKAGGDQGANGGLETRGSRGAKRGGHSG